MIVIIINVWILCYLFNSWTLTWIAGLFINRVHFKISVVCNDVTADVAYDDVIAEVGDGDIRWLQRREMTVSELQGRRTIGLGQKPAQSVPVNNVQTRLSSYLCICFQYYL